jgi:hypothetical protein
MTRKKAEVVFGSSGASNMAQTVRFLTCIRDVPAGIRPRRQSIMSEIVRGFRLSFHANAQVVPQVWLRPFLVAFIAVQFH